jgi:hypothetical protein
MTRLPALRFVAPSVHNVTEHQDSFGRLLVSASQPEKACWELPEPLE